MRWIAILALLLPLSASATTWFVRPTFSGTHNGTSWTTAWSDTAGISWGSVSAGDTVCLAGGTYTHLIPGVNGTSGNVITVKRAIASDTLCGSTTTGWNSAFDATVIMSFINFTNLTGDWFVFDGSVLKGWQINVPQGNGTGSVDFSGSGARHDIVFQNFDLIGPCDVANGSTCTHTGNDAAFYVCCASPFNITIRYTAVHGVCTAFQWASAGALLEHDEIYYVDDATGANCHPDIVFAGGGGGTIRNSSIHDFSDENLLISDATPDTWAFYGNIMYNFRSTARIAEAQQASQTLILYNNTFDSPTNGMTTAAGGSWNGASSERNNIWEGGITAPLSGVDYELCSTGACTGTHSVTATPPFVNLGANNYNLTTHTAAGLNLGSPYNVDANGTTRTNWDRGAFEFVAGSGIGTISAGVKSAGVVQ